MSNLNKTDLTFANKIIGPIYIASSYKMETNMVTWKILPFVLNEFQWNLVCDLIVWSWQFT